MVGTAFSIVLWVHNGGGSVQCSTVGAQWWGQRSALYCGCTMVGAVFSVRSIGIKSNLLTTTPLVPLQCSAITKPLL